MFSRIPNLRIYKKNSGIFSHFLLKQGRILLLRSKNVSTYNYLFSHKRHFAAPLKADKKIFAKKIRRFRIREKTCHEQVKR